MNLPGSPGHVSVNESDFDGSVQITTEPAWLTDSIIKLGLFKSSSMAEDEAVLTALVKGAHSFDQGESLEFNVNGEFKAFTSPDELTDIETTSGYSGAAGYVAPANFSSKRYVVSVNFLEELIQAQEAFVRINLSDSVVEGKFSSDALTTARPSFRRFLEKVEEHEAF